MDHALRRFRLARRLAELDLDVLVVTRLPNVRYLTGFTGSNAQVVLARDGDSTFLTDGRYGEQARHEVPDVGHSVYTAGYPRPLIEAWRSLGATRVGFERKGLTYEQWEQLTEVAEGAELVPVGAEVEALRITKDPEEITLIAAAQEAADVAFERVILRGGLREGRTTEREVARALDAAMLDAGADERGFETIVAFGPSAAEPHHDPTDRPLSRGDVVKLDFGGLMGGYHSDMTRTVAFGEPDVRLREIHDLVAAAQRAGIAAARAGASTVDVDAAARNVIRDAGHAGEYPHGLGHGVGLEIHEAPFMRWDGGVELAQGAVVTIEPGVYIPGLGGVRIEDMVEVTADGCREIPRSTKELVVL
ncbi:MAG TPA: Xaa-Pro peptidase family protein [Actinomycetota bacterium]|nr:Xaa-Pro peptidase family protein [Actinomycetota bacterium]